MRSLLRVGLMLSLCATANAQLAFEVAAVKPAAPGQSDSSYDLSTGRIHYKNVPLREILVEAFDVKRFQIVGPAWIASARFDISAKFPEGRGEKDLPEMLRTLLVERFHLKFHKETREAAVYALAEILSELVDRPVLDFTGTTEIYRLALEWTNTSDLDGTDLFGALQRKGLKLDSVAATPTEN